MSELTTIQQDWLKAKVIEFGMKCSKEYFKHYSNKNPDARAISKWVNKTSNISEDKDK